jgi:microcystin-dependent protein
MIVDNLKSCYTTLMRVRLDPELIVPVRWYFAPPGAQPLPTETAFGSSVWETNDREYPQPGLGEISLAKTWDKGLAPPAVTGLSTTTPLDWFVNGIPAEVVYPPPNAGVSVLIDLREEVRPVPGRDAVLTDEGALALLGEELPQIRRWQFLLFTWPASVDDNTTFADLVEAEFPGYARKTPTWSPPGLAGASQAATFGSTMTWTRAAGGGPPVTIFGWAAIGPGAPVHLRAVQTLPAPITLRVAGDNVTLCPVELLAGVCAVLRPLTVFTTGFTYNISFGTDWRGLNGRTVFRPSSVVPGEYLPVVRGTVSYIAGNPPIIVDTLAVWSAVLTGPLLVITVRWDQPPGTHKSEVFRLWQNPVRSPALGFGDANLAFPPPQAVVNGFSSLEDLDVIIGQVIWDAGVDAVPQGFLECNGAAVSRSTYAQLFGRVGETYGPGDGSTTFNLPNLQDRAPVGSGNLYPTGQQFGEATHTLITSEMPSHIHTPAPYNIFLVDRPTNYQNPADGPPFNLGGSGGTGSTGGDQPHNNLQPSLGLRALIFTGVI